QKLPYIRWHLLPIAAMTLPGDKPINVVQQSAVTPEELWFQRKNQEVFDDLQAQKLLRAVYSERQLEEVLTDFWFNHFNVTGRKTEERPCTGESGRRVIHPQVLGGFRALPEARRKTPRIPSTPENWLSGAPPAPPKPQPGARTPTAPAKPLPPGRGLNEN